MPLINNRYDLLDMLGTGGMGEVFRARDILTGETVALKRVTTDPERLVHSTRSNDVEAQVVLAQEFQTLASLRHPNIISVLDYGFDISGSPYLTMPLIHNGRKITAASRDLPTNDRVRLIIDMLQAVAYLHRRGILHRDLKPGNVLVTPDNDVKVLDFGLAVHRDAVEESGGTLFYMAPEVITGSYASEASDLYSVGVIAFEVLTGQLPYNSESMNTFLRELFAKNPDLSLILQDTLPVVSLEDLPTITLDQAVEAINSEVPLMPGQPMLAAAIGKLLAKFPDQRYGDAMSVIRDLSRAIRQPVPRETEAIRDSYLQAATFVGRQAEKQQLQTAIHHVMDKQGSLWLIGGESGVGKSRLVNEVRTPALVLGAQVVRGQELENASLAFQVWRDVLPTLLLNATVEDSTASVLKELVPTIEQVLKRPIPDAPTLPGNSGRERLVLAIIDVLKAQTHPMMVILEDLQWSTVSLLPLEALQGSIKQLPVIILGTFRNDERPELPDELPHAQTIILERLAHKDIVTLTTSMLGKASAQDTDLMEFIERESEGNTYFMVEVVRALAEELGSLSYIQGSKLPTTIETRGIQLILRRRLNRVPAEYQSMLQLAAVAGRSVEPDLLHYIEPEHAIQGFLFACNDAGVMTVEGNRWQFSHDKLRVVIFEDLSDQQQARLSRDVALAIEALHPDDEDYLPALASFWREAGDEARFLDCAIRAADYLVQRGINYMQARDILQEVLPIASDDLVRARVYRLLGDVNERLSDYEQAIDYYERAQNLLASSENSDAIQVMIGLSEIATIQGNQDQARYYATEALVRALAQKDDSCRIQAIVQLALIATRDADYETSRQHWTDCLEIIEQLDDQFHLPFALRGLGITDYYQNHYERARNSLERSQKLFHEQGNRREEALSLQNLGNVELAKDNLAPAQAYYQRAAALYEVVGDRRNQANVLNNMGMAALRSGDLEAAEGYFHQCLMVRNRINDVQAIAGTLLNLGLLNYRREDYEAAERYYQRSLEKFEHINQRFGIAILLNNLGLVCRAQGNLDRARDFHERSLAVRRELDSPGLLATGLSDVAYIYNQLGDYAKAMEAIKEGLQVVPEDSLSRVLSLLTAIVEIDVQRGRLEEAAQLLGFIRTNHAIDEDDRPRHVALLKQLGEYPQALEEGAGWHLDDVIADVLEKK